MSISYKALESSVKEEKYSLSIVEKNTEDLPKGDLLIKVRFSSLNYKDAMSATGIPGVTREYPHTPGIDAVGEIVQARQGQFKEGDLVIVSGYRSSFRFITTRFYDTWNGWPNSWIISSSFRVI